MNEANTCEVQPESTPEEILERVLLNTNHVHKDVLRALVQGLTDLEFGLALHRVREKLRTERHIEFINDVRIPGALLRANDRQKVRRGEQFARTGLLKQKRAVRVLEAVNPAHLHSDERPKYRSTVEKVSNAATRAEQAMAMAKPSPTVCEVPSVPRRGQP